MQQPVTLVLGASTKPNRYSYRAVSMLRKYGHKVEAVGNQGGVIEDVTIHTQISETLKPETITLYLNPIHQKPYYNTILKLKPRRVIFNPGAENSELAILLQQNNIESVEACTLVLLSTHQY